MYRPTFQWKYLELNIYYIINVKLKKKSFVYLESRTPIISKIISSNMVQDNENVVEKISCTNRWWTS